MIEWRDLNPKEFELTENQQENLKDLAERLTRLELEFRKSPGGFLFTITSGFRNISDHYRIYRVKGIDRPPMGSQHLTGQAADISDPLGILMAWLNGSSDEFLASLGLYYEKSTLKWVHAQSAPPVSHSRFFQA